MGILKKAVKLLSDVQLKFISDEFAVTKSKLLKMPEAELDGLYDKLCDIEVEETIKSDDGKLSERGDTASSIVTVLGNEIAKSQGDWDKEAYEKELEEEGDE